MGRTTESIKISVSLSSHNSEQDDIDEALWREIRERVEALISEPRYRDISPMTF